MMIIGDNGSQTLYYNPQGTGLSVVMRLWLYQYELVIELMFEHTNRGAGPAAQPPV